MERETGEERLTTCALGRQADPHAFLSVIPDIFNRESRVLF